MQVAARSGFGPPARTLVAAVAGFALGIASYFGQGAPSTDPAVVTNAFAQVFVVSAAEVMVCWALVGGAVEGLLRRRLARLATPAAAIVAAVLFGLYHFAHSAPFDTWPMVALLSVIGLVTGAFFFVSRDVLGTAIFHNFLGTFGVTQALAAAGRLCAIENLQPALLGTAAMTAVVLLAGYRWVRLGA
ncbi:CPBP family glutamic-type intramembrane protease [Quisquiliibacterium transsilvanicum]|uniref:Cation transport ATPase n=1 Tax=Quisquiliibacterium transsilvanicum TaxID=1549638 RepID=A0A7W8M8N8_9BURK|nr:CPBP family glutamic-type intramembrane protease [Quisquiliibacterium transsilvanicum]MBB5271480.1 cation transport ATPase [Quisquiliibacterium transsilvanicum]